MEISVVVYTSALEEIIYDTTGKNYVRLLDDNDAEIGLEECFFNHASAGAIDLTSPITFAVDSGTTVSKVQLWNSDYDEMWYAGDLVEETFAVDGAYTFSDIIVELGE